MKLVKVPTHEDWLEWRMGGIGSSDAGAIMDACKWMTKTECWALKTARMLPKPVTYPMRRGLMLEPSAREEYERVTGVPMTKACARSDKHSFLLASLDGVNLKQSRAVEIKCPGEEAHSIAKAGKIPNHYVWQLVHHLLVTDLPSIDYFSYRPNDPCAQIRFDRNGKLESRYLKEAKLFWECVVRDVQPTERPRHPFVDDFKVFRVRRSR